MILHLFPPLFGLVSSYMCFETHLGNNITSSDSCLAPPPVFGVLMCFYNSLHRLHLWPLSLQITCYIFFLILPFYVFFSFLPSIESLAHSPLTKFERSHFLNNFYISSFSSFLCFLLSLGQSSAFFFILVVNF